MDVTAIILAAGKGTRMKSKHAKVAHQILGKPMISWVIDAALAAGCPRIVVVVGNQADEVRAIIHASYIGAPVETVEQRELLGTGHAVRVALNAIGSPAGSIVVLNGDLPLIQPSTITNLANSVSSQKLAGAVLTMTPPDPFGYGRILLNTQGEVERIVEQKDCTPEEAAVREVNAGCYAFDSAALTTHIEKIDCNNTQKEYYLPDMVEIFQTAGLRVGISHCEDYRDGLGVNSRAQLAEISAIARDRINTRLMDEGVTFIDSSQAWISPDAQVGKDTIIWPQTHLIGQVIIGEDCQIGPNSRLTNTQVGTGCIVDETICIDAVLDDEVTCGPRAYLRPGTHMQRGSKAGTHVEIKQSTIGEGSKVPHLSYIGNTTMGSDVNVGAGSITCNYDGECKHSTVIGDGVFIGSDTMMVAPVTIGNHAVTGAASCITKDVPEEALALERSPQRVIEGYAKKRHGR